MSKISKENRKKVNNIYNQCVIYALIAGALSVPFIMPAAKVKHHKKHVVSNPLPAPQPQPEIVAQEQEPTPAPAAIPVIEEKASVAQESAIPEMVVPVAAQPAPVPVERKSPIRMTAPKSTPRNNGEISIKNTKIDSRFIDKMEGSVLKGYVPLPGKTKSGVTIASGFDLGQMHLKEFNQLPINSALKAKLTPYVGLKRFQAVAFLKKHPLTINATELQELNVIAANKILQPLVKSYDKASKTPFTSLPAQAQTALFSFAYQYGPGFMKKSGTSQLWNYYVEQNWLKVSQTLRSYKMYSPRRHQEAKLVSQLV